MGAVIAKVTMRAQIGAAIAVGALITVLVPVTAALPVTRDPALHAALETAATVFTALAALLAYGRYGRSRRRDDLVLTAALGVLAAASFGFSAIPALATGPPEPAEVWARALGAALLCTAAFVSPREALSPRSMLAACGLALVAFAALAVGPEPAFMRETAGIALVVGTLVLFAGAALGFTLRAAATGDGLLRWFAIAAVLATFACLSCVLDPSRLASWFAAGDLLWLMSSLCLLAGGTAELRRAHLGLEADAAERERRRIARDLHDGAAQDLAFILHVARRLAEREGTPHELGQLVSAARVALESTRHAIEHLAAAGDEPFAAVLRRTAREVAEREGASADVECDLSLSVPPATCDALRLVVREAVTNAVRHGGARSVHVGVGDEPQLRLSITDDGRGFDPSGLRPSYGLRGMGERVGELGGELQITSGPGEGTEIVAVVPREGYAATATGASRSPSVKSGSWPKARRNRRRTRS
jgi:signal transduction histidine kinase